MGNACRRCNFQFTYQCKHSFKAEGEPGLQNFACWESREIHNLHFSREGCSQVGKSGILWCCFAVQKFSSFLNTKPEFLHPMEDDLMCYSKDIFLYILCVFSSVSCGFFPENKKSFPKTNLFVSFSLVFPVIVQQIIISSIMDVGLKNSREFTFTSVAEGRNSLPKIQL